MSSLMVATPCYGKVLGEGYLHSIMASVDLARSKGHQIKVRTIGNESLITRARNNLTANFLASKFDYLMFIDSDITWDPKALLTLLEGGHEVCGIPYPTKAFDWEKVAKIATDKVAAGEQLKPQELRNRALMYTINRSPGMPPIENGWLEVDALGTGFLMMKRSVLERMRDHYREELNYVNDVKGYAKLAPPEHCVGLFEVMIDPKTRRYLSEDYAFCRRWKDLGGKIYSRTDFRLIHTGTADF